MEISTISNTNFKSTFPVVHWVRETNGSFSPVANLKITKKLQGKIVRALNKPLYESKKPIITPEQNLRAYVGSCDIDYRNDALVRSFYNREEGSIHSYSPVAYMITGVRNINNFEDALAKNIGRYKAAAKAEEAEDLHSPEVLAAIKAYNKNGLTFVNDSDIRLKDKSGMTYVLHTKFEILRNKFGKIKDYKLLDARFLPEKGPENPFEKLKR